MKPALLFLLLVVCTPEPRPPLPAVGPTLAQLDAIPGRVERLREDAQASVCRFEVSSVCEYPLIHPRVSVRNLEAVARR